MKTKIYILIFLGVFVFVFFIINNNVKSEYQIPPPPSPGTPGTPGTSNYSIPLKIGWNMVSVPVSEVQEGSSLRAPTLSDIKGCSIDAIWEYSASQNQYIQPVSLSPMKGYWIYSPTNCVATITGLRKTSNRNLMANRWEMISANNSSWNSINNGSVKCNLLTPIYHYNPTINDYQIISETDPLNDSKGYWVFVKNSCVISEAPVQVKSLTVISPNGGETWIKGTIQKIKWEDVKEIFNCPSGVDCAPPAPRFYDIKLVPYFTPCTGERCRLLYPVPYTIAKSVRGFSYDWSVGKYVDVIRTGTGGTVPDGSYTIEICRTDSSACDTSDSYFKVRTVIEQKKSSLENNKEAISVLNSKSIIRGQ